MQGQGWRLILEEHISIEQVIDGSDSLKHAERYNPPPALVGEENAFRVVYFSGSIETAHREIQGRSNVRSYALLELEYTLQDDAWVDLTDEVTRNELGVTLSELLEDWRPINASNQLSRTQIIGMNAYAEGTIEALKVPSAKNDGFNWMIFPDSLQPGSGIKFLSSQATSNDHSVTETGRESTYDADSEIYVEDENNNLPDEQESMAKDLMEKSKFD